MIEKKVINNLKEKYPEIHPLIFQRSVERARSAGELFDILSLFKDEYPVVWCEETRRWVKSVDFTQLGKFNLEVMKK